MDLSHCFNCPSVSTCPLRAGCSWARDSPLRMWGYACRRPRCRHAWHDMVSSLLEPGGCEPPCKSFLTLSVPSPSCTGPVFDIHSVLFMCMQAGGTDWTWLSRYGSDSCASVPITASLFLSLSLSPPLSHTYMQHGRRILLPGAWYKKARSRSARS